MGPSSKYETARAHPRLQIATPLQVKTADHAWVWNTIDLSIGGLGAHCTEAPQASTTLRLLFNLPNGSSVATDGVVCYANSDRVGVKFSDLPSEARAVLEDYTQRALNMTRNGGRIAKRLYVTLTTSAGVEQVGETVILSRDGGLLICRAHFQVGDELRLHWQAANRSAQIRVIYLRKCGSGDLIELGFTLIGCENFWQMEFPSA